VDGTVFDSSKVRAFCSIHFSLRDEYTLVPHAFPRPQTCMLKAASSRAQAAGTPFKFPIGRGQVIAGWEEALVGMSLGETAVVKIGANKAYGDKGFGSIIPPRSCLTFTITLLGINQTMAKSAGASSRSARAPLPVQTHRAQEALATRFHLGRRAPR
jgi:hypothetical protein